MRTKTIALLTAILLVLGISVAALAHPRGDPPRGDVSTLDTGTEQTTPTKLVREHQPVDHPQVTNDHARDRDGDDTTDRTPVQAREHEPVDHPEATNGHARDRDGDNTTDRTPDQAREHQPVDHPEATHDQTPDRDNTTDRTPDQAQEPTTQRNRGWDGHAKKGERQEHHSAN